jgi:dihydropyrimidinase
MSYDVVIKGGTLVTAQGLLGADLGITGERIAAIGQGLTGGARGEVIDAQGMLVIPGGIDPHVHLQMPAGPVTSSDDWHTGTVAAACGGTTTVIDFVEPEGGDLLAALAARRAEAAGAIGHGGAAIDFGLHMTLMDARPATLAQLPDVVSAGCRSFKTYLTYDGFRLSDAELLRALVAVAAAGGLALVHAENDAIVSHLRARFLAEGRTQPRWHPLSRPAAAEGEAVERALSLAEVAACPLYIVHISTDRGRTAVARARKRGQFAWGETCPQYLLLTDAEYDRPGFEGARFVCSPPLRTSGDAVSLWAGLASADLSSVGTDHCPFFYEGQKDLGLGPDDYPPFARIPGGMPGIESRLALLYTFGVGRGIMSVERWVEVCSTAPAEIFGLAGRKGSLRPGADADVVLFDPQREVTLSRAVLHERCDYTPYEGLRLKGYPVLTMLRGRVIAREGHFVGQCHGQYLSR